MDIKSGCGYPGNQLTNFAAHPFVFDGVECAGMEGFLQSLKFEKVHIQIEVCKLSGKAAKMRGKSRNSAWQRAQCLWWKGNPFPRDSDQYQVLLDLAYKALFEQSESFRNALKASGNAVITHSIGKNKTSETVLTEREFCSRLLKLREKLTESK